MATLNTTIADTKIRLNEIKELAMILFEKLKSYC